MSQRGSRLKGDDSGASSNDDDQAADLPRPPKRNRIIKRLPGSVTVYGNERYQELVKIICKARVSYYQRFLLLYEDSLAQITVEIVLAAAGLLSTALYIASTYSNAHSDILTDIELWLAIFFAADFFIRLAANGLAFLRTTEGFIDLLAVIPLISSAGEFNVDPLVRVARVNLTAMKLLKSAKILRVFRLIRIVRVYRVILLMRDGIKQRLLIHVSIGVAIVLFFGGLFQLLEDTFGDNDNRAFHDSCYFAVQTLTALGYGDVVPTVVVTQMLAVVMAFMVWFVVPIHVVQIISLARSVGSCVFHFVPGSQPRQHCILVLLTHCTEQEVDEFLREFFHSCHGPARYRIAVLGSRAVLESLASKLGKRDYIRHVDFVAGSVFDDNDLKRCCLNLAAAVFTMTHRICISQERGIDDDNQTLLAAISIKNICPEVPLYLHVNSQILEEHILWKTLNKFANIQLICVRQLSLSMLGRSCACPGMHVLVGNLLQSTYYDSVHHPLDSWKGEYHWGTCHSLFPTVFGKYFEGKTFADSIVPLYESLGVLPIAMSDLMPDSKFKVVLNPSERVVKTGDLVYVVAMTLEKAAAVPNFSPGSNNGFVSQWRHSQRLQTDALRQKHDAQEAFQMRACCPTGISMRSAMYSNTGTISSPRSSTKPFDRIQFGNHIVIAGFVEEHVFEFIWNLRNQVHTADIPVLVALRDADLSSMRLLRRFSGVYIEVGSLQDEDFLVHINLVAASHAVLFSNPAYAFDPVVFDISAKSAQQQIIDSDLETIMNLIAIENYLARYGRLNASNCITEFQFKSNLGFVRPNSNLPDNTAAANFHTDAADAKVHFAEVPQSMAALSFYYPPIFNIVQALLYGSRFGTEETASSESPAGSGPAMVMQLNLVRVPEKMENKTYSMLLKHFSEQHSHICLGLFRSKSQRNAPIPYVFVNPAPDTIICEDDHAFVIAPVMLNEPGKIYSIPTQSTMKVVTSLYKTKIPNLSSCLQEMQTDKSGIIQIRRHASESASMLRSRISLLAQHSRSSKSVLLRGLTTAESKPQPTLQ